MCRRVHEIPIVSIVLCERQRKANCMGRHWAASGTCCDFVILDDSRKHRRAGSIFRGPADGSVLVVMCIPCRHLVGSQELVRRRTAKMRVVGRINCAGCAIECVGMRISSVGTWASGSRCWVTLDRHAQRNWGYNIVTLVGESLKLNDGGGRRLARIYNLDWVAEV